MSGRIRIKHADERKRAPTVSREDMEFGVIERRLRLVRLMFAIKLLILMFSITLLVKIVNLLIVQRC